LPTEQGELFAASGACAQCHNSLVDEAGEDVSNDTDWRATMMANAARDPYWQASVRVQVIDYPHLQALIEDKCATCHTPMARFTASAAGQQGHLFDDGFLEENHEHHTLAIDGVSCTLCHQIEEKDLGTPESFSGGFSIDTERPPGERLIYGPFPALPGPSSTMQNVSGYRPTQGPQTTRSELCASCHTLYTPYVDTEGQVAGNFPEQVPYLEWQHSEYRDTHACQDCHMPPARGSVRIASTGGGPPRSPFAQHHFVGGNAYVLALLREFGLEMGVTASEEHFQRKIDQTLAQLQERTATLTIDEPQMSDGKLTMAVTVQNLAGHKVPSGFPSRRTWLHVTVKDANGGLIFESGAVDPNGSIAGNGNDGAAHAYEPHYAKIDSPDQVQIYEAILEDVEGNVTTGLLAAKGYLKDNRLLPSGFDKATAGVDIAVHGEAAADGDFDGGGDTTLYSIALEDAQLPLEVTVELLHQSIGFRWGENLRAYEATEVAQFLTFYDVTPNEPEVIAAATASVGG
jgi:hypothetical protein